MGLIIVYQFSRYCHIRVRHRIHSLILNLKNRKSRHREQASSRRLDNVCRRHMASSRQRSRSRSPSGSWGSKGSSPAHADKVASLIRSNAAKANACPLVLYNKKALTTARMEEERLGRLYTQAKTTTKAARKVHEQTDHAYGITALDVAANVLQMVKQVALGARVVVPNAKPTFCESLFWTLHFLKSEITANPTAAEHISHVMDILESTCVSSHVGVRVKGVGKPDGEDTKLEPCAWASPEILIDGEWANLCDSGHAQPRPIKIFSEVGELCGKDKAREVIMAHIVEFGLHTITSLDGRVGMGYINDTMELFVAR